ncbi:hypothetical protein PQX77_002424 [Marasmius sp. AFHP31]|nr:hypothetical protein PQX77_002424 [Marasmius sp. AFHP31]
MTEKSRKPYQGDPKLILSLDNITLTADNEYSSFLEPHQIPRFETVTTFPEQGSGSARVRTILAYGSGGDFVAAGQQAVLAANDPTRNKDLTTREWFKLKLFKKDTLPHEALPIPSQEDNIPLLTIFSDFLRYLFDAARDHVKTSKPEGENRWNELQETAEFILPHPNGWDGTEQSVLRRAAVNAGLISDTREGHERLHFVTEGEASLHYCISNGLSAYLDKGAVVVDAGGGTIDISTYAAERIAGAPFSVKVSEIYPPICELLGSAFITHAFRKHLQEQMEGSRYIEDLDHIVELFNDTTKKHFRGPAKDMYIKFRGPREHDEAQGVRDGQLRVRGEDIATFFEPSIASIVESVETVLGSIKDAGLPRVFLVGGMAASDYIFNELESRLSPAVKVFRPFTTLTTSEGAISYYVDHIVSTRVSRFTYGINCHIDFDPENPQHVLRNMQVIRSDIGKLELHDSFHTILERGKRVTEETEIRKDYYIARRDRDHPELNHIDQKILVYEGTEDEPQWMDNETRSQFRQVATLRADTGHLKRKMASSQGKRRRKNSSSEYWQIDFAIVLLFGGTELKAQLAWQERGRERRSPIEIVYEHDNRVVGR